MKLYETLCTQLKKENNFVSDNGELKKWVVADKARNYDARLLALLLANEDLKKTFFKEIRTDGVYTVSTIFLLEQFLLFIEQKNYLNDSYTSYRNKIGLTIGGKFLNQRNEVELVWPYKDCILEGGQTKEDQKRPEIFFNQTLAQDEITQLLDPKVLTNAKRYGRDGVHTVSTFTRNAELNRKRGLPENTITDNLIIKGNNLLALHSLKKEFAGKVKLIYIDPPFNTGKDDFKYNDNFNHSSWLSFMRNRLIIAKELLSSNGNIFVHIDFHEVHYLKILMDEIYGNDNFRNDIVWCYTGPSGSNNFLPRKHDDILFYSKTNNNEFHIQYIKHKSGVHNSGQVFGNTDTDDNFKEEAESLGKKLEDFWVDIYSTDRYRSEMLNFAGQKPEALIERIINIGTSSSDIVLDFFGGSGTTAAVAHKMNRQYISCEQIDSQMDLITNRLRKVINGDQSGISKSVSWNPQNPSLEDSANGRYERNNFVYLELKKYNQAFIERIEETDSSEKLLEIWEQMKEKSFLNYNVDIKTQEANIEDFKQLELAEQKQVLCELLDKNQLYVNVSDMNDERFATTEEEKNVTQAFYSNL